MTLSQADQYTFSSLSPCYAQSLICSILTARYRDTDRKKRKGGREGGWPTPVLKEFMEVKVSYQVTMLQ